MREYYYDDGGALVCGLKLTPLAQVVADLAARKKYDELQGLIQLVQDTIRLRDLRRYPKLRDYLTWNEYFVVEVPWVFDHLAPIVAIESTQPDSPYCRIVSAYPFSGSSSFPPDHEMTHDKTMVLTWET